MTTKTLIRFEDLHAGDRIKVTRRVKVGLKIWEYHVAGTVVRTDRRRNGLHVERNHDDKVFQDLILLRKDGPVSDETTVTLDEYTVVERA